MAEDIKLPEPSFIQKAPKWTHTQPTKQQKKETYQIILQTNSLLPYLYQNHIELAGQGYTYLSDNEFIYFQKMAEIYKRQVKELSSSYKNFLSIAPNNFFTEQEKKTIKGAMQAMQYFSTTDLPFTAARQQTYEKKQNWARNPDQYTTFLKKYLHQWHVILQKKNKALFAYTEQLAEQEFEFLTKIDLISQEAVNTLNLQFTIGKYAGNLSETLHFQTIKSILAQEKKLFHTLQKEVGKKAGFNSYRVCLHLNKDNIYWSSERKILRDALREMESLGPYFSKIKKDFQKRHKDSFVCLWKNEKDNVYEDFKHYHIAHIHPNFPWEKEKVNQLLILQFLIHELRHGQKRAAEHEFYIHNKQDLKELTTLAECDAFTMEAYGQYLADPDYKIQEGFGNQLLQDIMNDEHLSLLALQEAFWECVRTIPGSYANIPRIPTKEQRTIGTMPTKNILEITSLLTGSDSYLLYGGHTPEEIAEKFNKLAWQKRPEPEMPAIHP